MQQVQGDRSANSPIIGPSGAVAGSPKIWAGGASMCNGVVVDVGVSCGGKVRMRMGAANNGKARAAAESAAQ